MKLFEMNRGGAADWFLADDEEEAKSLYRQYLIEVYGMDEETVNEELTELFVEEVPNEQLDILTVFDADEGKYFTFRQGLELWEVATIDTRLFASTEF